MRPRSLYLVGALSALALGGASAQNPNPNRIATAPDTTPATVTVTIKGADAKPFVTVQATNSDVRQTLTDIATKSKIRVLLSQSANGVITGSVSNQPPENAILALAKLANLTVRKVFVAASAAEALSADEVGRYAGVLNLPVGAILADPTTGRSIAVAATTPNPAEVQVVVYCVAGQFGQGPGAGGNRNRRQPTGGNQPGQPGPGNAGAQPNPPGEPNQALVDQTAAAMAKMPLQQRMDTLRALQQQMMQGLTDEERNQMRQNMRGGRGGGQRNGGGPGGPNGGGPGGPPPGQ